jgi:Allene oxide cyclase
MRKMVAVATIAAAAVTVIAFSAGAFGQGSGIVHVIEHATTDAVTNPGVGGEPDNVGDILTFANPVFDEHDSKQVGTDQGSCVRTVVGSAWECTWTTFLHDGPITVEGPFYDAHDSRLAITGGTGAYASASGWMELKSREGGTKFDFVFHLGS